MSKELTEQWHNHGLTGWYYMLDCTGKEWFRYLSGTKPDTDLVKCFKEVLGPVPGYMDCKGLIYDSISLDKARTRIDELVAKTDTLEKKLDIVTKALQYYAEGTLGSSVAQQALKEIEDVQ